MCKLIGPRVARNQVHDVFAIVCPVDTNIKNIKNLPQQRDLHVTDASTDREVLMNVLVDAVSFNPALGTVALFCSVTTHEWMGGSLKAYPKDCCGRKWCIPDPVGIEGCDGEGLRRSWLDRIAKRV